MALPEPHEAQLPPGEKELYPHMPVCVSDGILELTSPPTLHQPVYFQYDSTSQSRHLSRKIKW